MEETIMTHEQQVFMTRLLNAVVQELGHRPRYSKLYTSVGKLWSIIASLHPWTPDTIYMDDAIEVRWISRDRRLSLRIKDDSTIEVVRKRKDATAEVWQFTLPNINYVVERLQADRQWLYAFDTEVITHIECGPQNTSQPKR